MTRALAIFSLVVAVASVMAVAGLVLVVAITGRLTATTFVLALAAVFVAGTIQILAGHLLRIIPNPKGN